ncbi:MAG: FAD-dependent oxidoreductase [Cyanobacteriota bacterium]|nr:FAD-dependent oxidoreductase [Cyanobacteriota bacterium]
MVVVGAGLAGGLLALALARQGQGVTLVAPAACDQLTPTALSYGGVLGSGGRRQWQRLQASHGALGWSRCGLRRHGGRWPQQALTWPFSRVDAPSLQAALPGAWAAAGVRRLEARVLELGPTGGRPGWRLRLDAAPVTLDADQVVLAAGAASGALWPALNTRLRTSWAGVLTLADVQGPSPWLAQVRRGRLVLPHRFGRAGLERSGAAGDWCVDAGLAPWGRGAVLGQVSWLPAAPDQSPPAWLEQRLRQGLAELDPALGRMEAPFQLVPVSFCRDGQPWLGPVPGAAGLWACCGFSGPFGNLPAAVERLAAIIDQHST